MNDLAKEEKKYILCIVTGKRCYTEREAGRIINSVKRHHYNEHRTGNKDIPKRKYFCRDCGCFHLTKQPKFDEDSIGYGWEKKFYRDYEDRRRNAGVGIA